MSIITKEESTMIHTIQLYTYISLEEIRKAEGLYALDIADIIKKIEAQYDGVRLTIRRIGLGKEYIIYLFLDAIRLLRKARITEVDYNVIQEEIDDISKKLYLHKENERFVLLRIDYRYDVQVKDSKVREFLFKLYQKSMERYRFLKRCNGKKKTTHEKGEKYKTTCYFNSKSLVTVVYDKVAERKAKGEKICEFEENVLRFEVRLLNNHLKNNKRNKGMAKNLETYMKEEVYLEYMNNYICKILQVGDYYTIREARKKISASTYKEKDKKALEEFLIKISRVGIEAVIAYRVGRILPNGYSRYKMNKYMTMCKKLGINPVLIPINSKMPKYISNPLRNLNDIKLH